MKVFLLILSLTAVSADTKLQLNSLSEHPKYSARIVGGTAASIERVPWQLSLRIDGRHRCGASIISENRAITAAHCFKQDKDKVEQFTVLAGSTYRLGDKGSWIVGVDKFIQHPNFDSGTLINDVAVLWLQRNLIFVPTMQPVNLPKQSWPLVYGSTGMISGWGYQNEGEADSISDMLKFTMLTVFPRVKCLGVYQQWFKESMFCAGIVHGGRDASHCVAFMPAILITVRVGLNNLRDANSENTFQVSKVITHSRIVIPGKASDFAILELRKPITFVKGKIEPACFNLSKKNYGNGLVAVGFGATTPLYTTLGIPANTLTPSRERRQAQFKEKTSGSGCRSFLICIKPVQSSSSMCLGDSGSPIHFTRNGRTTVEGVASFVTGRRVRGSSRTKFCNGEAAYSRASYYKSWFESKVGVDSYCKI